MHREEFILTCSFACIGMTGVGLLLSGCVSTIYFAKNDLAGDKISIKKTEFIRVDSKKKESRKFVLVKTDKLNYPIYLARHSEELYTALLMECTHKSCEVQPQGNYLVCPCHGSEFTNEGKVQNPPAEQNLHQFKTMTDHENIYIIL